METPGNDRRVRGRSLLSAEEEEQVLGRRDPLERLAGVGPRRLRAFARLGLRTVGDLLRHLPRSYRRFAAPTPVAELVPGMRVTVRATVVESRPGRSGSPTEIELEDPSGRVKLLAHGPAWRHRAFPPGTETLVEVEVKVRGGRIETLLRESWPESTLPEGGEAFAPVYRLGKDIPPRSHRRWLREAFERARPALALRRPRHLRAEPEAPSLADLLSALHFPRSERELRDAQRALALEEAVAWQVAVLRLRKGRNRRIGAYADLEEAERRLRDGLPFALGADQVRAIAEIGEDLRGPRCMTRLLSGDVGSGKTVVSWFPLIGAALSGRQSALLAPTELLARQHHIGLVRLAAKIGLPEPVFLAGKSRPDRALLRDPERSPLLVGTHRLVSEQLDLGDLAAVVIDEQHKFGVRHRVQLWSKGASPDLLSVSATPIPRTLAQSYLGYLDHSCLGARPGAERRVLTEVVTGRARAGVVDRIAAEVAGGGQVFVVCPAVGEEGVRGSSLPAAEEVGPWLRTRLRPTVVEILHGRQASDDKSRRLDAFAAGRISVLVSTVVIEVGVDVPDASMVVVLGAERFGLSQLHQIRGRVGRRGQPASCLLVSGKPSEKTRERLEAFQGEDDGFRLAELDLELRGPGEVLGLRQSGPGRWSFPEALLDPDLRAEAAQLAERLEARARSATGGGG